MARRARGGGPERAALAALIRRLRGGVRREPGPTLELLLETPSPTAASGAWRFWLWLIGEQASRAPSVRRLRVRLDPPER